MTDLIHRIYQLPTKGNDPVTIVGTSSDVGLAEAMKAKYKLEKWKRGYVVASIKDRGLHIATQLLAGKLMRKCCIDEVPAKLPAVKKIHHMLEGFRRPKKRP